MIETHALDPEEAARVERLMRPLTRRERATLSPLELLRYHVSGAIARGEAEPIVAIEEES